MDADEAALRRYYGRGRERGRLSSGRGQLAFTRTTEIVLWRLPPVPAAVVSDTGGGPADGYVRRPREWHSGRPQAATWPLVAGGHRW